MAVKQIGGATDESAHDGARDAQEQKNVGKESNNSVKNVSGVSKTLSKKRALSYKDKESRTGVIYMGSVPPYMGPDRVRRILSQYGEIDRIYLVAEDETLRRKRMKAGGNRGIKYIEGWVEFKDKAEAKSTASALHGTRVGPKKRDRYYNDLWNLKFLRKFKWSHLTEKIAYDNRMREQRLKLEVAQAKKESAFYFDQVERAKKFQKMEERKNPTAGERPALNAADSSNDATGYDTVNAESDISKIRRRFKQRKPLEKDSSTAAPIQSDLISRVFASGTSQT